MTGGRRCAWLAAIGLAASGLGCQVPRVHGDEVSREPIAFIYYSEDLARRRADAFGDAQRRRPASGDPRENRGVLDLNAFGSYLGDRLGPGAGNDEFAGRIALLDAASGAFELLEAATRGSIPLDWSSDHRRLLFSQESMSGRQLYEYDRETSVVLRITRGPDLHPWGCYGPGGRVVMMVAEIFTDGFGRQAVRARLGLLAAGGAVEFLTDGPYDRDPTCAPDGSAIAWVRSNEAGVDEVWVRALPDGEARAISPGFHPSFSQDGEWIVYNQTMRRASTRLWRIHRNGAGRRAIGEWTGDEERRPQVSPDGKLVVYESIVENRYRLFVRRMDGTGNRVLFSDGDGTHAVW